MRTLTPGLVINLFDVPNSIFLVSLVTAPKF
jgi:hypothetical protein